MPVENATRDVDDRARRTTTLAGHDGQVAVAVERLVEARRVDALRRALRGPSPEGRVYAVEALERLAQEGLELGAEDRAAIETVRALPALLGTCSGCFVTEKTAAAALAERDG